MPKKRADHAQLDDMSLSVHAEIRNALISFASVHVYALRVCSSKAAQLAAQEPFRVMLSSESVVAKVETKTLIYVNR